MALSDEMSLKFQSLFFILKGIFFKSFSGTIYFDSGLCERSGTVPMHLAEAEGELCSPASFLDLTDTSNVQLSSNGREVRPKRSTALTASLS